MKRTFALLKTGCTMWLVMALLVLSFISSPARAEPAIPTEFYAYLPAIHNPYPAAPVPGLRIAYSSNWTGELMQYNVDTGAVT